MVAIQPERSGGLATLGGEGAIELIATRVSRREQDGVVAADSVVAVAPVLKGFRGDAAQVVDFIFESLSR